MNRGGRIISPNCPARKLLTNGQDDLGLGRSTMRRNKRKIVHHRTKRRPESYSESLTEKIMRILLLATTILLASSSLCPSFAQEAEKADRPPAKTDQKTAVSPQSDQSTQQPQDQRTSNGQTKDDDRGVGHDWKMHRRDNDRSDDHNNRAIGQDSRMHRDDSNRGRADQEMSQNGRMEHGGDRSRQDCGGYERERGRDRNDVFEEGRGRRRVKICVEYENGDEYCRYR